MKKAFFFSMDAFFAVMIFTLVLLSVYSFFINVQELRQQYFYSEDLLDIFTTTKMGELNQLSDGNYLKQLDESGVIDRDLTVMEQMVTLTNQGYPEYSRWIFLNLTSGLFGERYGLGFDIGFESIFESERNVTALVARQRFVSGMN